MEPVFNITPVCTRDYILMRWNYRFSWVWNVVVIVYYSAFLFYSLDFILLWNIGFNIVSLTDVNSSTIFYQSVVIILRFINHTRLYFSHMKWNISVREYMACIKPMHLIEIDKCSLEKIHLKMSSSTLRPFVSASKCYQCIWKPFRQ